jgi:hypothetical protein
MVKLLFLYNFLITATVTVMGLVNAKAFNQTIFALLFAPLAIYFFRSLMRGSPAHILKTAQVLLPTTYVPPPSGSLTRVEGEELNEIQVADINRRLFLKLIGAAGLTTFLFALFTKSSHAAFFGSVPGPGTVALKDTAGNKIDPAEKQPTDGYEISQVDDAGIPAYYGFLNVHGAWYIAKEGAGGDYKYIRGPGNFDTSWGNRLILQYVPFNTAFSS